MRTKLTRTRTLKLLGNAGDEHEKWERERKTQKHVVKKAERRHETRKKLDNAQSSPHEAKKKEFLERGLGERKAERRTNHTPRQKRSPKAKLGQYSTVPQPVQTLLEQEDVSHRSSWWQNRLPAKISGLLVMVRSATNPGRTGDLDFQTGVRVDDS